jgi:hypothetical protein
MVTVAVAVFDNQRITTRFAVESHRTQSTICRKWLQAEPAPLTPPPRAAAFDPRIKHGGAASLDQSRSQPGRWYLVFYSAKLPASRLADCVRSQFGDDAQHAFETAKSTDAKAKVLEQARSGHRFSS